jgi:hypothetical protein
MFGIDPRDRLAPPLVKLGQGDTETEYFPDMFHWTEYLMGLITGAVVVGLAAAFL